MSTKTMWTMTVPWWELIVRSMIIYVFLLVLIRVTGKRQVGQLAPFDLILLLVLSNAVQNAMNGGDNSVQAGLISALTLVTLNYGIGYATYRSKRLEALIEGRPQVLIHNGELYKDVMEQERLTQHELDAALRRQGVSNISHVRMAMIENNGEITVQLKSEASKR